MITEEPKIVKLARVLSYVENPKHSKKDKADS